jgi:hypothetical protein
MADGRMYAHHECGACLGNVIRNLGRLVGLKTITTDLDIRVEFSSPTEIQIPETTEALSTQLRTFYTPRRLFLTP